MACVKILISNIIFIIILNAIGGVLSNEVKTRSGDVRGIEIKSILEGEKYYSFLGIPYAEPPVGSLRFMVSGVYVYFTFM